MLTFQKIPKLMNDPNDEEESFSLFDKESKNEYYATGEDIRNTDSDLGGSKEDDGREVMPQTVSLPRCSACVWHVEQIIHHA